jgi:hypothetical protein
MIKLYYNPYTKTVKLSIYTHDACEVFQQRLTNLITLFSIYTNGFVIYLLSTFFNTFKIKTK